MTPFFALVLVVAGFLAAGFPLFDLPSRERVVVIGGFCSMLTGLGLLGAAS